jgi:hypothetical protein
MARGKIEGDICELERLFSVYKIEGGTKILLGGLVERIAKRKFAETPDEDIKIFLREE